VHYLCHNRKNELAKKATATCWAEERKERTKCFEIRGRGLDGKEKREWQVRGVCPAGRRKRGNFQGELVGGRGTDNSTHKRKPWKSRSVGEVKKLQKKGGEPRKAYPEKQLLSRGHMTTHQRVLFSVWTKKKKKKKQAARHVLFKRLKKKKKRRRTGLPSITHEKQKTPTFVSEEKKEERGVLKVRPSHYSSLMGRSTKRNAGGSFRLLDTRQRKK